MITNKKELTIPKIQPVKFVQKGNGIIKGYAVNTFHGMVKDYNQDRVSIIMNITKPNYKGKWPKCSYFGVFDGHGGDACSNFLKDNMHKYITQNQYFPNQPLQALKTGFKKAELQFLKLAQAQNPIEKSGSCALVVLVIDDICYIANVGDSRAILSTEKGTKVYSLSYDHKPDSQIQKSRIQRANGKVYQSIIKTRNGLTIPGPYRINPGKLSVSRSFGDIQAKLQKYGGNSKVLIAKPEITYFQINSQIHDFIILGSDGIYDKMTNEEIVECFWERHSMRRGNLDYIGEAASKILNQSMMKMSMDNITSLIIVFEDHGKLQLPRKKVNKFIQQSQVQRKLQKIERNQKQNTQKQIINVLKSDRQLSGKIIQKITSRRKSTSHFNSNQQPQSNTNKNFMKDNNNNVSNNFNNGNNDRKNSSRLLRKDNTMKVLPSHKTDNNRFENKQKQFKEEKDINSSNTLSRLLKSRNVDKIR